jgi:prolyl-tRNA synthetase
LNDKTIGCGVRVSHLFGTTLRDTPAEADIDSHGLLLRAGYVRQLAAGIFSYLPLAWRSVRKIDQILREEMDRIGGQEINMPVVHPAELWQATGRWYDIDDTMARFQDRRGRDMLLAMTHEEVVARLASTEVRSYRQLPMLVYHIQTKFRDELRSRGGLIRVREFQMKDSYSLDRDPEGLARQYEAHYEAYHRIGQRVGLSLTAVLSDVGMMGGAVAHEFMYVTPIGEDSLALCPGCGYAANRDVARFHIETPTDEESLPLEKVHTPGARTIGEVCEQLGVQPDRTGKMVFYVGTFAGDADLPDAPRPTRLIVCVVRGDMEVNPIQVQNLTGAIELRSAHEEEILEAGMVPGAASPIGVAPDAGLVLVDELVVASPNLVLGANESDYHLRNVCCGRDYEPELTGAITAAFEGAPCAECGTGLDMARGVEVGNIFQLGTKYSEGLEAFFTDEDGSEKPIYMGSYGIGLGRLLACVAEEHRDEQGLRLPISVAPFEVCLVSLARSPEGVEAAERLYGELVGAGLEVLYDDREDASAGVKLKDADLRGIPIRVVIGERSLKRGGAELKGRADDEVRIVPLGDLIAEIRAAIDALEGELILG